MAVPHVEALAFTSMLARRRLLLPALGESAPRLVPPRPTAPRLCSALWGTLNPEHEARKAQGVINLHNACNMFVWPRSGPGLTGALSLVSRWFWLWPGTGNALLLANNKTKLHFAASFFAQRPALCHLFFPLFTSSPCSLLPFFPLLPSICSSLFFLLQQNLRNINYVL